jgi:hypothetical protein
MQYFYAATWPTVCRVSMLFSFNNIQYIFQHSMLQWFPSFNGRYSCITVNQNYLAVMKVQHGNRTFWATIKYFFADFWDSVQCEGPLAPLDHGPVLPLSRLEV